ncbi:MAG: OAM dimerization domain-containing protein [Bacillota bacterium]|nr:OAM dimerization domain-containing protein [Bacillota bacterium]
MAANGNLIRPYGSTPGDGQVQVSFTLPIKAGARAREAAKQLAGKMGLSDVQVVHMKDLHGFTYFILYGSVVHAVDLDRIPQVEEEELALSFDQINGLIEQELGRQIVVVGACTGTDAHTVGLDAIMNMKGYGGEYGLERYPMFDTYNLGSQVPNEVLLAKAREVGADAVLVSQVVTERNAHLKNLTELIEMAEAEGLRQDLIIIAGGPRIDQFLATELGFDAGFGPGTTPRQVAAYLAQEMVRRL